MIRKRFDDMSEAEFDGLIDGYIERTATGYGEMPAEIFPDLLAERIATKTDETVNLSLEMVGGKLVIKPDREVAGVVVHGNEILADQYRPVLKPTGQMLDISCWVASLESKFLSVKSADAHVEIRGH